MARRQTTESLLQSLPEDQRVLGRRILESVPRAQQPAAAELIAQVVRQSGERAMDALRHLEGIVSSGNFRPHHLSTLSLLARRSGPNAAQALREFESIINHEKFNRFVLSTVNLALTRAGEESHEALRALRFLLSNPNFTQRSLNIALPEMFVRFLDTAIRSGGDADYMAIRAMAGIFANSSFGPGDFNARFGRTFGAMVRTVRDQTAPSGLSGLEALGTLLGNGAIRPQDLTAASAESLARIVNLAIEYTRASEGGPAGAGSPIDEAMRTLNLILGNRSFRPEMMQEGGLLARIIDASTQNERDALSQFLSLMRSCRQHPQAMETASSLAAAGHDPFVALFALNALVSNPALAPMLEQEGFSARFGALLSMRSENISRYLRAATSPESNISGALGRALGIFNPNQFFAGLPPQLREAPALGFLTILLSSGRISPEILDRVMATLASLGGNADIAVLCLGHMASSQAFRPQMLDQEFLGNLAALANQAAAVPFDFRLLAGIFLSRNFRPSLIAPGGLVPLVLRTRSTEAEDLFRMVSDVMGRRAMTPELEAAFRECVSVRGAWGRRALDALAVILQNAHITPNTYPAILRIVRSMDEYSASSLRLYNALFSNPNLRPMLTDPAFVERLCGLMRRAAEASGANGHAAIEALSMVMQHPSFRPRMMEGMDSILRSAGRSSRFVFSYLQALQGVGFSRVMQPGYRDFLCRMARFISRHGGADPTEAHQAFSALLGDMRADAFLLQEKEDDVFAFLEAAAASAGTMSPLALRAILPRIHLVDLDEDEAAYLGAFIRDYMNGLPDRVQREAALPGVANMLTAISRNSDLHGILFDNSALYREGRDLAGSLITDRPISPDVILNFAYGISRIGAGRVRAIYQRFGIRHFARYSDRMLDQLYRNRDHRADPSRPTVFVTFPHWDHNGAFYREGRTLDDLLGTHNVVVFEAGTEREFYQAAYDFRMRYGRTRDIVIGGHGQPDSIRLGTDMEAGMLDMTDADELRVLRDVLGQEPRMILVSCSTGANAQAIGAMMSRVIGAALFAPREPAGVRSYGVDSQGRITVEYRSERGFFFEGVDLSAGQ